MTVYISSVHSRFTAGYTAGSPTYASDTIAEYKDGIWSNVGNLAQARYSHGAITSGSTTLVVGGYPYESYM